MRTSMIVAGSVVLFALACGRANDREPLFKALDAPTVGDPMPLSEMDQRAAPPADAGGANDTTFLPSSTAARVNANDTTHRFIRTADLRFRVKDVVQASLGIEDIVGAHDGWVECTQLKNVPAGKEQIPVSADSTLEVSRYDLVNTVTLRVPNTELDSTLRAIGRWADLFDHRTIQADDVRLHLMANAMAVRRQSAHGKRLENAIGDQGRKLKETTAAEEALLQSGENADQARLANLGLQDRIAYSTVKLDIYQRTLVRRELVANDRSIEAYRPPLAARVGAALGQGWHLLEGLLLALLSVWPLMVIGAIAFVLLRKRMKPAKA